jgi:ArsR family transcriptional regulator, virulence genes transcriptional regulator
MKNTSTTAAVSLADFAANASQAATFLRELANERRLMILCQLLEQRELSVMELADRVGLSQSALSQHLARLRESGLVRVRRHGSTVYYSVADKSVGRVLKTLKTIFC